MVPGPIIIRVASFFPFHATYWLNGHPFMEQELNRRRIGFCKTTMPFPRRTMWRRYKLTADHLSPLIIRKQLDYRTLILGPRFSRRNAVR